MHTKIPYIHTRTHTNADVHTSRLSLLRNSLHRLVIWTLECVCGGGGATPYHSPPHLHLCAGTPLSEKPYVDVYLSRGGACLNGARCYRTHNKWDL